MFWMYFEAQSRLIPRCRIIFRMCPSSMSENLGRLLYVLPLYSTTRLWRATRTVEPGAQFSSTLSISLKDAEADTL